MCRMNYKFKPAYYGDYISSLSENREIPSCVLVDNMKAHEIIQVEFDKQYLNTRIDSELNSPSRQHIETVNKVPKSEYIRESEKLESNEKPLEGLPLPVTMQQRKLNSKLNFASFVLSVLGALFFFLYKTLSF
ncbi:hypothetical protein WICMUC_003772 [Wickerhamomyces mucosus]|uniref:Uncharacterized protein n=1 Tax=Wickerhamomyces mucosus TaxID=1378264 RepID=A0A9P8PK55_9ASCO|nr:hypothetical protein WICMUC_003772 [Wickerhamomyces mucosus]